MTKRFALAGRRTALLAGAGLVAMTMSQAVVAQTTAQDENEVDPVAAPGPDGQISDADGTPAGSTITVTGSRIRSPNLNSVNPITSIGGETIFQQADTNIGETLNDLPQLASTFAQTNPGLGIGIAGLNLLDLRGLGTQRTLVLVNGRRHVPADILNNAVSPDVASIPNDLIERVDIVTGGNSAVYGSDAIAGVVNFVLRQDFDGIQLRATANVAEEGFGGNQYISAMAGQNFADGRGNITLHGEYNRQERVFASDIPEYRSNDGFSTVDSDGPGLVGNSDGFPDSIFLRDRRSTTISPFGLVAIGGSAASGCGVGTAPNTGGPNTNGTPFNCTYVFTPAGQLVRQTGVKVGAGPFGTVLGGNNATGREGELVSILPQLERYNANLLARYEFSPAAELFLEAKYNRVNAVGNNAGPSFIQGTFGTTDFRERVRLDNPFLGAQNRTFLTNEILRIGNNAYLTGNGALTAAQRAQIADGSYRFSIARNLIDVGLRDENFERDTYRVVGGVRGDFFTDFSYELSANYGKFEEAVTSSGYIDRQRFALALDAGRNPVTGQIQCRSQFDPASAIALQRDAAIFDRNQARLAQDIAACVPYNPFGAADNRASVDYFGRTFTVESSIDQLVLQGFVSGSTSSFFELPGGPVRFSLGAEYRREEAFYQQDPFVTDGFTNGVSIPTFGPVEFEVKELFGEVQIPIISGRPFFEELTLTGAGRVSDYEGSAGTVYTYNAGFIYSPVDSLRVRGNYGRAVRAPNVSETGFPLVPNFAPGFVDPCSPSRIDTGPNRRANCEADLGALLGNLQAVTRSLPVVSGSNPNLDVEKSDSYTLGAVFQPRFLPGFSLSVDYYDITVNGVITSLGAQTIADSCYDQPNLDNVFCDQFERFRGPGLGPQFQEVPGEVLGNSLIQAPLNFARRVRRGIDTVVAYNTDLTDDLGLGANLIYTHSLENSNFESPTNPDFENRILGELGFPEDEFRLDLDFDYREFTFGYRLRYIGSMLNGTYESYNSLNGDPPGNLDAFEPTKRPDITYSDLRFEWNLEDVTGQDFQFYTGVDNVFDRMPPFGGLATGGDAIYDYRGRSYYAGVRARF